MTITAPQPGLQLRWSRTQLGAAVLCLATAILVFRLPGSVIITGIAPLVSLAITGLHRPPRVARGLFGFLLCAIGCSALAVVIAPAGIGLVNFAVLAAIFLLFAVAVLGSGDATYVAKSLMKTLYVTFGVALWVGLLEMAAGFKLQTILYPDASNLKFAGRFLVSAWFPNYNDYAVVVTMFALMVLIRLLLDWHRSLDLRVVRLGLYLVASIVIVIGGSRGALVGLLVGSAVVILHVARLRRPRLVTGFGVVGGALALLVGAVALWTSPWVQDHSTQTRETIVANTLAMMPDTSPEFWLGWGDLGRFMEATKREYPGVLMDPHNVLLEVVIWYGLPTLIALGFLWWQITYRGLGRVHLDPSWHSVAAVLLFALTPVLGIVPSSSLRYYYLFLLAPCAVAFLRPPGSRVPQEADR